jgi:hypothetical protein
MTLPLCEHLEDYLLKDLAPEVESSFAAHLTDCDSCRLAIEQETRINGLLKTAADTIPVPPGLPAQIQRDWQRRTQKRWAKTGGLIAAGLVIGLLGWSLLSRISPVETPPNEPVAEESLPAPRSVRSIAPKDPSPEVVDKKPASPVRVEFPEEILGLPIDSGEPDITLIQLFPVSNVDERSP